jgi:alkylated DNA repair dioxygenase AlkB
MRKDTFEQTNLLAGLQQSPEQQPTRQVIEVLAMPDADVRFYRSLFAQEESDRLFTQLQQQTQWRQEFIKLYGKPVAIPRLTAWYGDAGKSYTYSRIEMAPEPWTSPLLEIKSRIEAISGITFNSVLLNLYRDGRDSVAWHSDDEPELGENPSIGSVSFGATRRFMFKHKQQKDLKQELELTHGSFLLMQGQTQHFWLHQIPKTTKLLQPRINLTFRIIT